MTWVDVAAADAVPPGEGLALTANGTEVAIFNTDGRLHAISRRCPHKGGDLSAGIVRHGAVICPLHWWRFDLRTGQRLERPGHCVPCYPVRRRDGRIEVLVPPPEPSLPWRERLLSAGREWSRAR